MEKGEGKGKIPAADPGVLSESRSVPYASVYIVCVCVCV